MTPEEYVALRLGQPVIDPEGQPCVVIGVSPGSDSVTAAYGDEACFRSPAVAPTRLCAHFEAFELVAPGSVRWDGERWVLA